MYTKFLIVAAVVSVGAWGQEEKEVEVEDGLRSPQVSSIHSDGVTPADISRLSIDFSDNNSSEIYKDALALLREGNKKEAYILFKKAADMGHQDAALYQGDVALALKEYELAAIDYTRVFEGDQFNSAARAIAANNIGLMWEKGQTHNGEKDLEAAQFYFEMAQLWKLPVAKENLKRVNDLLAKS